MNPDATARQRFPRCATCGELIVAEPVDVTLERDGQLTRVSTCGGSCALRSREPSPRSAA